MAWACRGSSPMAASRSSAVEGKEGRSRRSGGPSGAGAHDLLRGAALLHGMQSDHVPVKIDNQRDEAVLADRKLVFHDLPAVGWNPFRLDRAVFAVEVDDGAVPGGLLT